MCMIYQATVWCRWRNYPSSRTWRMSYFNHTQSCFEQNNCLISIYMNNRNYQHFSLFIVGFPFFMNDFNNSFNSLNPNVFFPSWLSAFTPSINFTSLYYIYRPNSYSPTTIFFASSMSFMSSVEVCNYRISWDSSCFFSQSASVWCTFSSC